MRRLMQALGFGLLWMLLASAAAIEPVATIRLSPHRRVWEVEPMAFSVNRWLGFNGDWNNTSNWSQGAKPGANDVAIFDKTSSTSVTTNLDQSGQAFAQMLVKPGYSGNMGSQGAPLRIDITLGILVWRGSGQGFINPKAGTFPNVVCDVAHGYQTNRYDLVLGGMGVGIGGELSQFAVKRGNVNVMGDISFAGRTYILGDAARLVMEPTLGATEPPHIMCAAGELINSRPLAANQVLIVGDRSRVTQIGALLATTHVVVIGNGKFKYLPTSAPGTSPLLSAIGGVYDQTDEKFDNVWGTTVIGPDAMIIGGAVRGTNLFPASLDLREEYPGAQE